MGGLLGGNQPSSPPPTPLPPTTAADPEEEARKERLEAISRNRRGLFGTIATSERGVLDTSDGQPKSLLGE